MKVRKNVKTNVRASHNPIDEDRKRLEERFEINQEGIHLPQFDQTWGYSLRDREDDKWPIKHSVFIEPVQNHYVIRFGGEGSIAIYHQPIPADAAARKVIEHCREAYITRKGVMVNDVVRLARSVAE